MAAAERFQQLYGDLKEVARLWRAVKRPKGTSLGPPPGVQWELLGRATAAESKYETIVIKLATERRLSRDQIRTLGLFRQAIQEVRESIRYGRIVPASGLGGEYLAFNDLAADVTQLVGSTSNHTTLGGTAAKQNLQNIALVREAEWRQMVREYEETKLREILAVNPESRPAAPQ